MTLKEDYPPLSYGVQSQIVPGAAQFLGGGVPVYGPIDPGNPESESAYLWTFQFHGQVSGDACVYWDQNTVTQAQNQMFQSGLSAGAIATCMEGIRAINALTPCPCWDVEQLEDALEDVIADGDYRADYKLGAQRLDVYAPERPVEDEIPPFTMSLRAQPNSCSLNWRTPGEDLQVQTQSFGITPAQADVCGADVRRLAALSWACTADLYLSSCPEGFSVLNASDVCAEEGCVTF